MLYRPYYLLMLVSDEFFTRVVLHMLLLLLRIAA